MKHLACFRALASTCTEVVTLVRARSDAQRRPAKFCNEGSGEGPLHLSNEGGREAAAGGGASVASFHQAAADQTGLIALAERKPEGTTGKTLTRAGKNLKRAERQSRSVWLISLGTDLFYSVPDHFPLWMLASCDRSPCLDASAIAAPPPPLLSQPNLYN